MTSQHVSGTLAENVMNGKDGLAGCAVAAAGGGRALLFPTGICQVMRAKTTGVGFYILLSWARSRGAAMWTSPFFFLL